MSMTKKDFIALAQQLHTRCSRIKPGSKMLEGFDTAVDAVMYVCREENPRFDIGRFIGVVVNGTETK